MIWEIFIVKLLNYLTIAANRPNWKLWNATYYPHFNQNDEGFTFQLNSSYEKSINCVAVTPSYNSIPLPPTLITYYEIVQHILHSLNSWQYRSLFASHSQQRLHPAIFMMVIGYRQWAESRWQLRASANAIEAATTHNVSSDSIYKSKGYCWAPFFCTTTQDDGGKHRWIHTSCWTGTPSSLQSISSEKRVHKYFFVCHPRSLISTQLKKINSHERKSGESVSRRKIIIKWTSG